MLCQHNTSQVAVTAQVATPATAREMALILASPHEAIIFFIFRASRDPGPESIPDSHESIFGLISRTLFNTGRVVYTLREMR